MSLNEVISRWEKGFDLYSDKEMKQLHEDVEWLIDQAKKVEQLDKALKTQNTYCIVCGDDATEVRQGNYYCHECCQ